MKKGKIACRKMSVVKSVFVLALALVMALGFRGFGTESYAATGTVTVTSANIRASADPNSAAIGSAAYGATLTVNGTVTGTDGNTWYEVVVDSATTGYIRSDLMQTSESVESTEDTQEVSAEGVTQTEPVSATVTGNARVRTSPVSGSIITTTGSGVSVTVTGYADGSDGYTWYLVSFTDGDSEVEGYMRSDFLSLSGELVDAIGFEYEDAEIVDEEPVEETVSDAAGQLMYEVVLREDGSYYLVDYAEGEEWQIEGLLDSYETAVDELTSSQRSVRSQRIIIIVLVIVVILCILAITMLVFRIKEVQDDAYFAAVEKETIRERKKVQENRDPGRRPSGSGTGGNGNAARKPAGSGTSAQGSRPASSQGSRSASSQGSRPTSAQGSRPASSQGRPASSQATRPASSQNGAAGTASGQRVKPAQAAEDDRNVRTIPAGSTQQTVGRTVQSPTAGSASGRPVQPGMQNSQTHSSQSNTGRTVQSGGTSAAGRPVSSGNVNTQSRETSAGTVHPARQPESSSSSKASYQTGAKKNPSVSADDDDDEFEFEFLNWDDSDK